ncbi:hypothetical protein J2Z31_002729 [Sinorhizobium kostiense]|uniref:Transposase n=1 Tax=Sinorhizobium kostiense TaxID=76747 RepID=A0ABS4R001_9HYPH|nr:hypothetical protein [Sinorhizobium kostiense]
MSGKTTADGHDVNNRRSLPLWSKRPEGELRSTREFLDTVIESLPVPCRTAQSDRDVWARTSISTPM